MAVVLDEEVPVVAAVVLAQMWDGDGHMGGVLADRLARGDIDVEEYARRRDALRS